MSVPDLITVIVAVVGWFLAYQLGKHRDHVNRRRDLRVEYLIDAYRRLESASNRDMTDPDAHKLESAIADVQLFGSPKQVAQAQAFAGAMHESRSASLDELLMDLRRERRDELRLDSVPDQVKFLRMSSQQETAGSRA